MRIKKIVFSNINNLKGGPHVVSFEDEPLNSAGIFAITGPTGSGKSTILDVITLALYNRIPRHGRVSKKAIVDHGSVITHHAISASAAVDYEVNGRRYTSTWSVEKARTGNLKDYEMSLTDASGNFADVKKSQVPDQNTKIIGLNYDQFVKSIILSQGEFSKFLKANKNERGEMLEKLTGTDIYRSISIAAYNKSKQVGQELLTQEEILGEMNMLSDDEREATKVRLRSQKEERINTEAGIKKLSSLVHLKSRKKELKRKLEDLVVRAGENEERLQAAEEDRKKLADHDSVASLARQLTVLREAKSRAADGRTFIKEEMKRKLSYKNKLKEGLQALSVFVGREVGEQDFQTVLDDFVLAVQRKDMKLEGLKEKGKKERSRIQSKVGELSTNIDLNNSPSTAIEQLNSHLDKFRLRFQKAGIKEGDSLPQVRTETMRKVEEIATLSKLSELLNEEKELASKIKGTEADAGKNKLDARNTRELLAKENEVNAALKAQEQLLVKRKQDALKIASLENLRAELVTGEPCPLCGAIAHPLHSHEDGSTSEIDAEMIVVNEKLAQSLAAARQLEKTLAEKDASIRILEEQHNDLAIKLDGTRRQVTEVLAERTVDSSTLPDLIQRMKVDIASMEDGLLAAEEAKIIRELIHNYEELTTVINQYRTVQEERNAMYPGSDVSSEGKGLAEVITQSVSSSKKSADFILDREQGTKISDEKVAEMQHVLAPELEKRNLRTIDELSALLLSHEVADDLRKYLRKLEDSRTSLETELVSLERDLKDNEELDEDAELALEDCVRQLGEKEGARDALNLSIADAQAILKQDQDMKVQYEKRLENIIQLKKQDANWSLMDRMIGSAKGDKFANFAQSLTLQTLLARTNRRLIGLTDRYLLNKPNEDGALSIIDRYQGNTERSVTTLSGGEVFIISLALALSLSDMASKNIALESLFIDEGFGTLDQETLDVAMTTLEKLQSENQKVVGVISHVEALKDRITTQVQLKKNAQGYSTIEVVS